MPKSLEQVRQQSANGEFDFTGHALRPTVERNSHYSTGQDRYHIRPRSRSMDRLCYPEITMSVCAVCGCPDSLP